MTDSKTLKLFRKQAMTTLELDLNIWINSDDYISHYDAIHNFLTKAIKRKTKAPAYKKLKKEVEVLIKWGVLYEAFPLAILRDYGYETYLKLYQDLEGTHDFMDKGMTILKAKEFSGCV